MRKLRGVGIAFLVMTGSAMAAEEAFDACQVFTQDDAQKALGVVAAAEPVNPKVKRPKVVTACAYNGFKDGKPVEARAQFKWAKTEAETQKAFDEEKLKTATKPLLISGVDSSYWSAKTGQMNVRKGRTWVVVQVGPPKPAEREMEPAKALAEALARKL